MMDEWICDVCGEKFKTEVDLLAHQFNSTCERELQKREQAAKLAQLQAIATAAREYFHKTKGLADFAHIEYEDLEAALAALEQETK